MLQFISNDVILMYLHLLKMNPIFGIVFATVSVLVPFVLSLEDHGGDAMRECGLLHQVDFRLIPSSSAEYSNHQCRVKCMVGNYTMSTDDINEGHSCPVNTDGVSVFIET